MKNKKTVLSLALIVLLIVSAFAPKAHAQQYDPESDFQVGITGGAITIIKYIGTRREVRIPPRIQNLPVTSIRNWAFRGCTSLTNITFQDTITSSRFNANAFYGNLRDKFYAANKTDGTPGTYTRPDSGLTWTRQ